jgi:hypothetical protein
MLGCGVWWRARLRDVAEDSGDAGYCGAGAGSGLGSTVGVAIVRLSGGIRGCSFIARRPGLLLNTN